MRRTRTAAGRARPDGPPGTRFALWLGAISLVAIGLTTWLASRPGAEAAQTGLAMWFNDPPEPFALLFAAVNPLCRPVPLLIVGVVLVAWVLLGAGSAARRWEVLRAIGVSILIAELFAQLLKRAVAQPRPLVVIPGLDAHGYPADPLGNAYPSAHTAVAVAIVGALWPWMGWPQRVVGVVVAVIVALNRLYIGAHWPVDLAGGAAIGLLAAAVTWQVAARWPIRQRAPDHASGT